MDATDRNEASAVTLNGDDYNPGIPPAPRWTRRCIFLGKGDPLADRPRNPTTGSNSVEHSVDDGEDGGRRRVALA